MPVSHKTHVKTVVFVSMTSTVILVNVLETLSEKLAKLVETVNIKIIKWDFKKFEDILKFTFLEIDACFNHACVHGQCTVHLDEYVCGCDEDFTGRHCDICKLKNDISNRI